jgi:hypothetical protein
MKIIVSSFLIAALLSATSVAAQSKPVLKNKHLTAITQNGVTLKLGGEGHGYEGRHQTYQEWHR